MKKNFIGIILTLALAFSNIAVAYAAEVGTGEEIRPLYEETAVFSANFDIDSAGTAEVSGTLKLLDTSSADKVCAVVKITNVTTGKVVYNKTITLEYSKTQKRYLLSESVKLSAKGTHRMNLTYKCYDGSKLLETVQATSVLKTYS